MTQPASPLPKLLLYLLAVMLGGALLAPVLFDLGHHTLAWMKSSPIGETGPALWLADNIERASFTRFFNRAVLVCALLFIVPLLRSLELDRRLLPTWRPLSSGLRQWLLGFVLAAGLLLAMGFVCHALGAYRLRPSPGWLRLGEPITAALGAGIVEEFFFRALLLGLLLRTLSTRSAVLWAAFIFAIVHFMKPPDGWKLADEQVVWSSGFSVLAQIARGFGDIDFLLAEFATLFAVGWVLTQARLQTGRLWAGIGLHGGWVFGLKWFSAVMTPTPGWLPWIGPNLKVGLLPLLMVLFTGWITLRLLRTKTGL